MGWILETITFLAVSLSQPLPTGNSSSLLAESWTYFWYLFLQETQVGNELVPDSCKLTGYLVNAHSPRFECRTQQSIFLVQVIVNTCFTTISNLSTGGREGLGLESMLTWCMCFVWGMAFMNQPDTILKSSGQILYILAFCWSCHLCL